MANKEEYTPGMPGQKAELRDYFNLETKVNELFLARKKIQYEMAKIQSSIQERAVKIFENEKKINDYSKESQESLEKSLLLQKQKLQFAEHYHNVFSKDLVMARDSLGIWDSTKLSAIGFTKALKDFDYIKLEGSWKNSMYYSELIQTHMGKIGIKGAIIFELVKQIVKVFQSWDEVTTDLRKQFGGYRDEIGFFSGLMKTLTGQQQDYANKTLGYVVELSKEFGHLGVTMEVVGNTITGMVSSLGSTLFLTKDLVKQAALMQAQFGIGASTTSDFLLNMSAIGGGTMTANKNLVGIAQSMSQASQVPLDDIMNDVAKASGTAYEFLSRNPITVLKTVTALRAMGTSLENAAQSSDSILDFSSSINKEMEASVLLGRDLNLGHARQLAYNRDTVGEQNELLRIAKSVNFTRGLDKYQQEAVASAMGMSVDQLSRMLATQEQLNKARRDPALQGQVKAYDDLLKSTDAQLKAAGKNNQLLLEQKSNQTALASISNSWGQITTKIGSVFLPMIAGALSSINGLMTFISKNVTITAVVLGGIWVGMKKGWISITGIGKAIEGWSEKLFYFATAKNWKWLETIADWVNKIGKGFSGLSGKAETLVARIVGFINRLPFGKVITQAASFMSKFFGGFITRITGLFEHIPLGKFVSQTISSIGRLFGGITARFGGIATRLSGLFGGITARLGAVLKFVGRIAIPLMFAWNIFKRIRDLLHDPALMGTKGFFAFNGKLIIRAFGVIIGALWDTFNDLAFGLPKLIVKGFVWVGKELWGVVKGWSSAIWNGLKDFIGFSPSVLGKRIVNGIASVGGMIFNALTSPFKRVLGMISPLFSIGMLISKGISSAGSAIFSALTNPFKMLISWVDRIPFLGGIANKLGMGSKSMGAPTIQHSVEHKAQAAYIPAVTVSPAGTKIETSSSPKATKERKTDETKNKYTIDDLYEELCKLNRNLESGKIRSGGISLDTSLVSTTIARQTEFKGAYGVNRI